MTQCTNNSNSVTQLSRKIWTFTAACNRGHPGFVICAKNDSCISTPSDFDLWSLTSKLLCQLLLTWVTHLLKVWTLYGVLPSI